ncbi:hypothetical protein TNCV_800321 [Trichonephila clavipes]|nr:hypothetical protein TNCV_800321 [Trichonephila clavipes]
MNFLSHALPLYQPLEILLEFEKCCTAVDIWSAGCIFAELLLKKTLFPMREQENLLKQIFAMFGFPTKIIYKELYNYPLISDLFKYMKHHFLGGQPKEVPLLHILKNTSHAALLDILTLEFTYRKFSSDLGLLSDSV